MKYESSNIILIFRNSSRYPGSVYFFILQKYLYSVSASYCRCCPYCNFESKDQNSGFSDQTFNCYSF